jgi:predicted O-methyltransferase YrrM
MNVRSWTRDKVAGAIARRPGLVKAILRGSGSPRLFDLFESSGSWHTIAESMLAKVYGIEPSEALLHVDEARRALVEVHLDAQSAARAYPDFFAVEGDTALFLYAAVRYAQPQVVVETGVADGLSSALILRAMDVNEVGELHSIDIADDVGRFISNRRRWNLHVVDGHRPEACAEVLEKIPALDMFLHDGNHRYSFQSMEYRSAWPRLRIGGLLMSDDIDWSYAFLDVVRDLEVETAMLMDNRKVFGLVRKLND